VDECKPLVDGLAADAVEAGALRSALARISVLKADEGFGAAEEEFQALSPGSPASTSTLSPTKSTRPKAHWKKTVSNLKSANAIAMLGRAVQVDSIKTRVESAYGFSA